MICVIFTKVHEWTIWSGCLCGFRAGPGVFVTKVGPARGKSCMYFSTSLKIKHYFKFFMVEFSEFTLIEGFSLIISFIYRLVDLLCHIAAQVGMTQSQKTISIISPKFPLEASKWPTYATMWHRRSISRYLLKSLSPGILLSSELGTGYMRGCN